eukprot:CAMPEP_0118650298 /NCGR_PEP_ID=MMETSP0785-20121206/10173_1 /TAXON_ID=91992 /ORGANISM="Bolidomonas pacifica, Strain CCMP 1866" /LENGTH=544 /DNA_ID=CAMNT_0006542665 /DNA_START=308 /DNA_END=1942 /DNA_ORIENTATION=-
MWVEGCTWYECGSSISAHAAAASGQQQSSVGDGDMGDDMNMDDMFENQTPHSALATQHHPTLNSSGKSPTGIGVPIEEDVNEWQDAEVMEGVGSFSMEYLEGSTLGRSLKEKSMMGSYRGQTGAAVPPPQPPTSIGAIDPGRPPMPTTDLSSAVPTPNIPTTTLPPDPNSSDRTPGLSDSFHPTTPISPPSLSSFKIIKVIGKGSFGKVFLVREHLTGEMFALKVLRKDNIIKRNQVEHTRTERNVLGYVKHPFIVGLNMAFQTPTKLYFVLDYCAGGELFFHLGKVGKFEEGRARFYASEITLAIQHVHALDIIYRDLKPENVLLDARGHVRLTDFGLSKEGISQSSSGANSFCGTPEYLAPEILNRQGHGRAVDWWSLGALLYEMLTGLPPFYCRDREKLFEKIRKADLTYPRYLSQRACHILRGLLTRDPTQRLGSGPTDADEVKKHTFFQEIDWVRLDKGEIEPPWDPKVSGSLDTSQFDREFTSMPIFSPGSLQQQQGMLGRSPGAPVGSVGSNGAFEGFTFTDRRFHGPGGAGQGGGA